MFGLSALEACGKPTIIERVVYLFPGPYVVKCLVFSAVFGMPAMLFTRFLDTLSVTTALALFGSLLWQNVVTFTFANFVLLFYALYGVRYMRSRIAAIMPNAESLIPGGMTTLQKVFGPICRLLPAAILASLLGVVSLVSFPTQSEHAAGPIGLIALTVSFPFVYLAYGTFVWVYVSSVKCLYEVGNQPLQLAEFHEDSHLGMKPFGSLSLSLALVYFAGLVLVFFSFLSIPLPLELAVSVLILAGIVLFFLPLIVIHRKMRDRKRFEREKLKDRYTQLVSSFGGPLQIIQVTDVKTVKRMLALDLTNRQVAAIPEWPFDSHMLTWLSAIVLTVVASLVTRYVLIFLGL